MQSTGRSIPGAPIPGSGYWSKEDQILFGEGYQKAIADLEQTNKERADIVKEREDLAKVRQESAVRQAHLRSAIDNAGKAQAKFQSAAILATEIEKGEQSVAAKTEKLAEVRAQTSVARSVQDDSIKRIIGSALYTMVIANFTPATADQEGAKQASARCTQVIMPFLNAILTGPLKSEFQIHPEKACAQLPPEALTQIIAPLLAKCSETLSKQALILNLSEFKSELPELGAFLKGESRVSELRLGGLYKDPKAASANTALDVATLGKLAKSVSEIAKSRPLTVLFVEADQNARFKQLLAECSVRKALPVPPGKNPIIPIGSNLVPPIAAAGKSPPKVGGAV